MKIIKNNKIITIYLLIMLWLLSACTNDDKPNMKNSPDNILVNYNESDFTRIEKFVSRFNDGKADYFLTIPPIIDGGYWIYDFISDGKKIKITIDSSRDSYSDRSISNLICKGISIDEDKTEEGKTRRVLVAKNCEGKEKVDEFKVLVLEVPNNL